MKPTLLIGILLALSIVGIAITASAAPLKLPKPPPKIPSASEKLKTKLNYTKQPDGSHQIQTGGKNYIYGQGKSVDSTREKPQGEKRGIVGFGTRF